MILSILWTLLTVGFVGFLLYFAEKGSRVKHLHPELTRKFVHVTVGTFVAFWPFYLSWKEIATLSLLFMLIVGLSVRYDIFRSIHSVKRNATGEFLFGLAIGVLAVISGSKWIFMAAMLNLAIADGMAALVGILKGENNEYKVFGHTKSRAGTAAFLVTSFLISIIYMIVSGSPFSLVTIAGVPLVATVSENLAVNGLDNIVIPVVVALILSGSL
jgi:dolichol kinase